MSNFYKEQLTPFDIYISTKVIFYDYEKDEDTIIQLFDEYQIKWFNQQTADDLYEYFEEVITFYKSEEAFLCNSSSVIQLQNEKLSTGSNYGIMKLDDYANCQDEEDYDWIKHGWKNNYGVAVYQELERVLDAYGTKHNLQEVKEKLKKSESA